MEAIMNITYPDWHALQITQLELHPQEVAAANVHTEWHQEYAPPPGERPLHSTEIAALLLYTPQTECTTTSAQLTRQLYAGFIKELGHHPLQLRHKQSYV